MTDSYRFGTQEIESVLKQKNEVRFDYFIKRVADWGEVWGLKGPAGWVLLGDEQQNEVAVFWPFKEFAAICATGAWADSTPTSIDLDSFRARWLTGLERDGRRVAVFPNIERSASVLSAAELRARLEEELDNLE
ncbi:Protein of unknown function [Roseateles sp. YR242]|uniref:DUF2750 domain-containing protein n=1 Tax=Roseateles sp. YR242 TaxID=1855305 RepID=UPI0008C3C286|nr:DUF2750 domain-containing protein [Roseateles sp. YR242]SEL57398.1 Protein of unknown function [Roseateles sp. YR242]